MDSRGCTLMNNPFDHSLKINIKMKWWKSMKKLIVIVITLVGIANFFTPYDKVLADQSTSTAGIRFIERNDITANPNEIKPPQSGGGIALPQTGGKSSYPYYVIGIGLIGLASLLVMKSNIKNLEERRN
ncbi:hypothetical protein CON22_28780 [Bacillus cereus]|nr:hypothetical protein CON22_28780 [Bacillus cereus]